MFSALEGKLQESLVGISANQDPFGQIIIHKIGLEVGLPGIHFLVMSEL
jgi:hypothetical protein